jgi:ABC-type antimicrobial peptide transport system permease subunit
MKSVLYGVAIYDMPAIASAILVLASVTFLAASIPALRVARIDPAVTLREE